MVKGYKKSLKTPGYRGDTFSIENSKFPQNEQGAECSGDFELQKISRNGRIRINGPVQEDFLSNLHPVKKRGKDGRYYPVISSKLFLIILMHTSFSKWKVFLT